MAVNSSSRVVYAGQNMAVYNDTELTPQAVARLRERMHGQVIGPSDAAYDSARQVWNASINRFPGAIARCIDASDVVEAVNVAREAQVALAVRGGGHDVAGNGTCDGGLVLDLSGLKGIDVDPVYKIARVEAGVVWGELDAVGSCAMAASQSTAFCRSSW